MGPIANLRLIAILQAGTNQWGGAWLMANTSLFLQDTHNVVNNIMDIMNSMNENKYLYVYILWMIT